jgi:hypothetical protein
MPSFDRFIVPKKISPYLVITFIIIYIPILFEIEKLMFVATILNAMLSPILIVQGISLVYYLHRKLMKKRGLAIVLTIVVALVLSGTAASPGREALAMGMLVVCVAATSAALRRLCGSTRALAVLLPPVVVITLVICPVFFDLAALRTVQKLLPVTHYLTGNLGGLAVYTAASLGVYGLLGLMKRE